MSSYARRTTVAPAKTRAEIEHELEKRGASQFGFNREGRRSVVAFTLNGLQVRLELVMPDPEESRFRYTTTGRDRAVSAQAAEYEQEIRRRWRALLLVIKAKLVAVDEGITTLEREFLADTVLADGSTVLEQVRPAIDQARTARLALESPRGRD